MRNKPFRLTDDQKSRLGVLAKLGANITQADAAKILNLPEAKLRAYLDSEEGRHFWARHRAEGRAELMAVIRRLALEGSPQAQKLFAAFVAADDSRAVADLKLTGPQMRALLQRSAEALNRRAQNGDWIRPDADRTYRLADVIAVIPRLWDRLEAARATIAKLERRRSAAETDAAEAKRLLALEQLRARRRENDIAEGRLVTVEDVRRQTDALLTKLRQAVLDLGAAIMLKLGLSDASDHAIIQRETRAALDRLASSMEQPNA